MVVEDNCDAGGFELGHTPLLERESILTTIKIWGAHQMRNSSSGVEFGVPVYQILNDPISQLKERGDNKNLTPIVS